MPSQSDQKALISPEFAGALFFTIYAALFFFFTKFLLLPLKHYIDLPWFPALLIILLASALLGREFGKILSKPSHWIRLFGTGIAMAILAILLVSIGAMVHAALYDASVFAKLHSWKDYFIIYGLLVATITLSIGVGEKLINDILFGICLSNLNLLAR